jgi:hypothetical protein
MYLFNRSIETTGEMGKIVPILLDMKKAIQDAGVEVTFWIGGNGYKNGTVIFSANYATLADRAAATAKLAGSKSVAALSEKINPYIRDKEPDVILQYVKGGVTAAVIPVGAVVSSIRSELAQGADWIKTIEWGTAVAELNEKITGVPANLAFVTFGQLGGLVQFSVYANIEAAEAAEDTQMASAEWFSLFMKGGEFALAGSVLSRQMTKLA